MSKLKFLFITSALTLSACKKQIPDPELLDPIYNDINSQIRVYEQAKEDGEKKLEAAEKELEKAQPRTIDIKSARNDIIKAKLQIQKAEQLKLYYEVLAKERKSAARKSYLKAFQEDKPWPEKSEFEAYKQNRKLVNASRNWDDRVPKSSRQQEDFTKEAPAGEGEPKPQAGH